MNINDVVAYALKIRNKAQWFERMALDANVETGTVILTVYPFNGKYVEKAIGAYSFYVHNGRIAAAWING